MALYLMYPVQYVNQLHFANAELFQFNAQLQSTNAGLNEEVAQLRKANAGLIGVFAQLRKTNADLNGDVAQLRKTNADLHATQQTIQTGLARSHREFKQELGQHECDRAKLNLEIDDLTKKIKKTDASYGILSKAFNDLVKKNKAYVHELSATQLQLHDRNELLRKHCDSVISARELVLIVGALYADMSTYVDAATGEHAPKQLDRFIQQVVKIIDRDRENIEKYKIGSNIKINIDACNADITHLRGCVSIDTVVSIMGEQARAIDALRYKSDTTPDMIAIPSHNIGV